MSDWLEVAVTRTLDSLSSWRSNFFTALVVRDVCGLLRACLILVKSL